MRQIIISASTHPVLDGLLNLFPTYNVYILAPGDYSIHEPLRLNRNGVRLIGQTGDPSDVHIRQCCEGVDGLVLSGNNIMVSSISVHVEKGSNVCLSAADAPWSTVQHCNY